MMMASGTGVSYAPGAWLAADVAVLFARADSCYKRLPGCDVWDADRDARRWPGGAPVVAHPPCRAWGRLRQFAKPREDEKDLARLAVDLVRQWGGVLEHPASSSLWPDRGLPRPGRGRDSWGGWTLAAPQSWWGHRAEKASWFYIVGVGPRDLPAIPFELGGGVQLLENLGKAAREHTPPDLAAWLVQVARLAKQKAPGL